MIRHHDIYLLSPNGMMKIAEIDGTKRQQVDLRRAMRTLHKATSNQISLYTDGRLEKIGIDVKSS